MKNIALFIGRFQPLHLGHLAVIKKLSKKHDLVKIVIGSAQYRDTSSNPFSAEERKQIIEKTLKKEGIDNYKIYFAKDFNNDELWLKEIMKAAGKFDVSYSGNSYVIRIFKQKGLPVKHIREIQPYSSTLVRNNIRQKKSISRYVPKAVNDFLKNIFRRIR